MRRKINPLERIEAKDPQAKAKVSLVLEVLSGEKTIRAGCRETGLKPVQYYKLEARMVRAMEMAAEMPEGRRRRKDPLGEARTLAAETEELRREHRRMKSLMRVCGKLWGATRGKPRAAGTGSVAGAPGVPGVPGAEGKRRGRPPKNPAVAAAAAAAVAKPGMISSSPAAKAPTP